MTLIRPIIVGLAAASLLLLPGAVSASADTDLLPEAKVTSKAPPYATRIVFMPFDHVRKFGTATVVRGQIITDHGEGEGSIAGTVELFRRYKGSPTWAKIKTTQTTQNATAPRFTFEVRTNANAFYRARFIGDDDHNLSIGGTEVSAYRAITTRIKSSTLVMSGTVAPKYTGQRMFVERKTCKSCQYKRLRSIVVGAKSTYKTTLTAPRRGRWYFRLTTPASTKFIASTSATIATYRI